MKHHSLHDSIDGDCICKQGILLADEFGPFEPFTIVSTHDARVVSFLPPCHCTPCPNHSRRELVVSAHNDTQIAKGTSRLTIALMEENSSKVKQPDLHFTKHAYDGVAELLLGTYFVPKSKEHPLQSHQSYVAPTPKSTNTRTIKCLPKLG